MMVCYMYGREMGKWILRKQVVGEGSSEIVMEGSEEEVLSECVRLNRKAKAKAT